MKKIFDWVCILLFVYTICILIMMTFGSFTFVLALYKLFVYTFIYLVFYGMILLIKCAVTAFRDFKWAKDEEEYYD